MKLLFDSAVVFNPIHQSDNQGNEKRRPFVSPSFIDWITLPNVSGREFEEENTVSIESWGFQTDATPPLLNITIFV